MDVLVKEGWLLLQEVKFGKKVWRKIWMMAFQPSQARIGRIEMYDMREGVGVLAKLAILKKAEKRVIRLAECLSVTPAPEESCPAGCTAFYLNTAQRIYTLAAPGQDEWVSALCSLAFQGGDKDRSALGDSNEVDVAMMENDIYSSLSPGQFQVTVASSEASMRCSMFGSYLLSPEKESLCLLNMKTGHVAFQWPYRFLRRFGLVKDGLTIEAGRRCQTGEGLFIFLSKQGPQIYRAIEEAVMHQSVQDLLSEATVQLQDTMVQPPVQSAIPKSRKNLALPALPGPKPSVSISQPECGQAIGKVKPLPKTWKVLTPPSLPVRKLMTDQETKSKHLDFSNMEQHSPDSQLDSTARPLLHSRRKPEEDANQEHPKTSPQTPVPGYTGALVSFKQALSDALFKDMSRIVPSPNPKSHRESLDLDEPDYYEIQN